MANPQPRYARPADDAIEFAEDLGLSLGMTNEDPDYPVLNLLDDDPATVAWATANGTTITLNFTTAVTPKAIALINTNAAVATINGIDIPIPPPQFFTSADRLNPWRFLTLPSGTLYTLTLAAEPGEPRVWIGRICLLRELWPLNVRYGFSIGVTRPGRVFLTTRLGSKIVHDADIRLRTASGVVNLKEDEMMLRGLEASARGQLTPWVFIPDDRENDAWYVRFRTDEFLTTYPDYDVAEIPLAVEELSNGPPLG